MVSFIVTLQIFNLIVVAHGCMKTAEPATTMPPPVTTTGDPTTCSTCKKDNVQLLKDASSPDPKDPKPLQPTSSQNCNTLTVTCTAPAGENAFMEFNDERLANPSAELMVFMQTVKIDLTCTANGWSFTFNGATTIVTKIFCVHT